MFALCGCQGENQLLHLGLIVLAASHRFGARPESRYPLLVFAAG